MRYLHSALDWASDLYQSLFADWLHLHFVVRTAILLLFFWGALFLLAQLFQYVLGPLLVLFYRHVLFRAYNYLFVETPHEFIYIRYYAQDKPNLRSLYLRLSDKVKKNRLLLNHTRYKGILYRGGVRRVVWITVGTVGVIATLWLAGFGLHQEYFVPALAEAEAPSNGNGQANGNGQTNGNGKTNGNGEAPPNTPNGNGNGAPAATEPPAQDDPPPEDDPPLETPPPTPIPPEAIIYPPGYLDPALWADDAPITLQLNEHGEAGARLRDRPGFTEGVVIEMLWGRQRMEYLGEYTPDAHVSGLYWLRVLSPEGQVGYIASHLVEVV